MKKLTGAMIFENLKDLLREKKHWTKFAFARGANGMPIEPEDPTACSWCLMGGVTCVRDRLEKDHAYSEIKQATDGALALLGQALYEKVPGCDWSLMGYNDNEDVTHKDVLSLVRHAIKLGNQPVVKPKKESKS